MSELAAILPAFMAILIGAVTAIVLGLDAVRHKHRTRVALRPTEAPLVTSASCKRNIART